MSAQWGDLTTSRIAVHGAILSLVASASIAIALRINPRIWLQDYPPGHPGSRARNAAERALSLILGVPVLILLLAVPRASTLTLKVQGGGAVSFVQLMTNGFGLSFIFNLVDWLILDWLAFCALTPGLVVIPGTEGAVGYRNYASHFRGFLIGTAFSALEGAVIASVTLVL